VAPNLQSGPKTAQYTLVLFAMIIGEISTTVKFGTQVAASLLIICAGNYTNMLMSNVEKGFIVPTMWFKSNSSGISLTQTGVLRCAVLLAYPI